MQSAYTSFHRFGDIETIRTGCDDCLYVQCKDTSVAAKLIEKGRINIDYTEFKIISSESIPDINTPCTHNASEKYFVCLKQAPDVESLDHKSTALDDDRLGQILLKLLFQTIFRKVYWFFFVFYVSVCEIFALIRDDFKSRRNGTHAIHFENKLLCAKDLADLCETREIRLLEATMGTIIEEKHLIWFIRRHKELNILGLFSDDPKKVYSTDLIKSLLHHAHQLTIIHLNCCPQIFRFDEKDYDEIVQFISGSPNRAKLNITINCKTYLFDDAKSQKIMVYDKSDCLRVWINCRM